MFRYSLIKNWRLSRTSLRGLIICGHIAPFIATVRHYFVLLCPITQFQAIPFTTQWDFDVVRAQSVKEHSTYDLSIYAPFSGFSDTRSFQFLFVTAAIAIGAYFVPLMSVFVIRKIMIVTKAHSKMSENTKRHTRMLMKVGGIMNFDVLQIKPF